jgi:hypothetical protein
MSTQQQLWRQRSVWGCCAVFCGRHRNCCACRRGTGPHAACCCFRAASRVVGLRWAMTRAAWGVPKGERWSNHQPHPALTVTTPGHTACPRRAAPHPLASASPVPLHPPDVITRRCLCSPAPPRASSRPPSPPCIHREELSRRPRSGSRSPLFVASRLISRREAWPPPEPPHGRARHAPRVMRTVVGLAPAPGAPAQRGLLPISGSLPTRGAGAWRWAQARSRPLPARASGPLRALGRRDVQRAPAGGEQDSEPAVTTISEASAAPQPRWAAVLPAVLLRALALLVLLLVSAGTCLGRRSTSGRGDRGLRGVGVHACRGMRVLTCAEPAACVTGRGRGRREPARCAPAGARAGPGERVGAGPPQRAARARRAPGGGAARERGGPEAAGQAGARDGGRRGRRRRLRRVGGAPARARRSGQHGTRPRRRRTRAPAPAGPPGRGCCAAACTPRGTPSRCPPGSLWAARASLELPPPLPLPAAPAPAGACTACSAPTGRVQQPAGQAVPLQTPLA